MKKGTIVALCGGQGSGKSTLSKAIEEDGEFIKISFADIIYKMLSTFLEKDARSLPKEEPMEELGGKTLRQALQTLGTEWGRQCLFDGIWVEKVRRQLRVLTEKGYNVILDDLRFPNEEQMLREEGAKIFRIDRDGHDSGNTDGHASEAGYQWFVPDRVIDNDFETVGDFIIEGKKLVYGYL